MSRLITSRKLLLTISLLALLVIVAGYVLTTIQTSSPVRAQGNQPPHTLVLFEPFWETWDLLHEHYVDPLDDVALAEGALQGLLYAVDEPLPDFSIPEIDNQATDTAKLFIPFWDTWIWLHDNADLTLDDNTLMETALIHMLITIGDPHTDYMDPETFTLVNEGMSGEYEGIGAAVRQDEETGGLELVTIFEGSPAEKAGLQTGDQIIRVEGADITRLSQNEIIALVRGPAGTLVRLGIQRPNESETLKFEVVRGRIDVPSVNGEIFEGNIGYLRLSQFEFSTTRTMRDLLEEMNADNLAGLILDVRGNPGGYLTTSIEVASAYIQDGVILIERTPDRDQPHSALGNAIAQHVPMVVLVDQGSASASELIAGALQDHERALIVGMPTFGKGSVQTWRELSNGGGLRITISRWYTPDGNSVSEQGIIPDIQVPYLREEISGDEDNQLTAAIQILNGTFDPTAIENEQIDPAVR